jgi:hypothetical protein
MNISIKLLTSRLKPWKILYFTYFYKPVILAIMTYKAAINKINPIITKIRSFLILNKFLNGVKITKIKPAKLLMKKRG